MNDEQGEIDASRAPLISHLVELRRRLLYAAAAFAAFFVVAIVFAQEIYAFLVVPLADAMAEMGDRRMIATGLPEVLFTQLKVAFFTALMISMPVIAAQVWAFAAPGLYKHEKKVFLPFLVATPVLFALGAAMAYYVVFPFAWRFFLSFEADAVDNAGLPIVSELRVSEYLSIVMRLIFAFGVSFMTPVALTLMGYAGILSAQWLRDRRRYAIVVTFILAAIITPADPVSQIAVALPVLVLYELSILLIALFERRRKSEPE